MTPRADLPFVVKICGITNEDDARVAVEAGANALGFNFYPKSPRYIKPDRARQIAEAVPGEYLRVGVFVNPSEQELCVIAGNVPLDVVQLHGNNSRLAISGGYQVWRSISPYVEIENLSADAYLVDTPSREFGGSGKTFDWTVAGGRRYRTIIAGGLDASNVAKAIATAQPWGVDACSRLERNAGKKDAQRVRDFVGVAMAANQSLARSSVR